MFRGSDFLLSTASTHRKTYNPDSDSDIPERRKARHDSRPLSHFSASKLGGEREDARSTERQSDGNTTVARKPLRQLKKNGGGGER